MAELMNIGEFSAATWLSLKALRIYDDRGLLVPVEVDPHRGFRRYSPSQLSTARMITLLRRIDMPLDRIGDVLRAAPEDRAALIADHRERESERNARRESLAQHLEQVVGSEHLDADQLPDLTHVEVSMRTLPDLQVLTRTRYTSAHELPEVIEESAASLHRRAAGRGGAVGPLIVIYHGQVGWESDGPIEVCLPVEDPGAADRMEAGHRELVTKVRPADIQFPRILAAFEAVQSRAAQLGLSASGPPREVYDVGEEPTDLRCEVALPVR